MHSTNHAATIRTDVLVVGAGPTGLAFATSLVQSGFDPLVVDKLPMGQNTSRAAVIHAHTLEVLQQIGVADRLASDGLLVNRFSLRDRDDVLMRLRFDTLPTPFAHLLMLPQDRTESILAERLGAIGGTVHRGWTVASLTEAADGVRAVIETPDGRREVIARYVVGADGMQSLVRRTAGIRFEGESYDASFVLADVEMQWTHGRDEVMLFFSPDGLVVVAPLPNRRFRIVATLDDAPETLQRSDVQALLRSRGPTDGRIEVEAVHWSSRFRLHHRVAESYRRGPFLLVGDAAHVHSPAGGQGMNTGLVDACLLARILADVLSGREQDDYLDSYEALRRPAAEQVLGMVDRLTRMATMRGKGRRFIRNCILKAAGTIPHARQCLQMNLSGLSRRRAAEVATSVRS